MGSKIRQLTHFSCGYAAIKALLVSLGHGEGYAYVHEPTSIITSPSLSSLLEYAETTCALKLAAYRSLGDPKDLFPSLGLPSLFLLSVNGLTHMVVLLSYGRHFVRIYDPAVGERLLNKKRFLLTWTGVYLTVVSVSAPYKGAPALPLKKGESLLLSFLSLLSGSVLALGLFFLTSAELVILALALSCLSFLLARLWLYFLFGKMDGRAVPILQSSKDKKRRYEHYQRYKAASLGLPLKVASLLLTGIVLFLLAFMADKASLYLALAILLGEGMVSFLYHRLFAQKMEASFLRKEDCYYLSGTEADLKQLLQGQKRFALCLDGFGALRLVYFLVAIFLFAWAKGLALLEASFFLFVFLPLKEAGENLYQIQHLKKENDIAMHLFLMEEERDSFQ